MDHGSGDDPVHLDLDHLEFRDVLEERFPHPLQTTVLPVIALRNGQVQLRGTAFSIGGNLALTATHVVGREDDLREVALLYVEPGPERGQVHARLLPVEEVTAHEGQTDVAVLRLEVPIDRDGKPFGLRPLRIGVAPPGKQERVAIIGYTYDGSLGTVDEVLQLRPRLHVSEGTVVGHFPTGGPVCRYPSFQIDGRIDSQMSGGPVFGQIDGNRLAVRGVSCTGMDVPAGDVPYSFASMTFTAMALDPVVDQGQGVAPTFLYDLAVQGRLPVVDLELVNFNRSDPAHPRLGLRAPDDPQLPN